jgi:hypothetical protein
MERKATIENALRIMGSNFIGCNELASISDKLGILNIKKKCQNIPPIPFSNDFLSQIVNEFILILGVSESRDGTPLTLNKMRSHIGFNPDFCEPCFYNQDWYIKENFANQESLQYQWYLIKINILEDSRGVLPEVYQHAKDLAFSLPSAILCSYTFFSYYFLTKGNILWKHDYIWTRDSDHNGDQVYVGRYIDPNGMNKNGFSIHRHLSINKYYGIIPEIRG